MTPTTKKRPQTPLASTTQHRPSVLIVGTGLTGAICCHQLRAAMADHIRIEAIDMARGVGGRMSTTRWGNNSRANTGAQYASCVSSSTKQALFDVCALAPRLDIEEISQPVQRSLHFRSGTTYSHFGIPGGTNNLVKQFLYAGRPDTVSFETRLTKLWKSTNRIVPEFDLRRGGSGDLLSDAFDVVILALPPKDAAKFFQNNRSGRHDPQSQADLHRHYKKQSSHNSQASTKIHGVLPVSLDKKTSAKMRGIVYVGRYSLILWFDQLAGTRFAKVVFENWQKRGAPSHGKLEHDVLDAVFLQEQGKVLVAQSTVDLWKKYSGVSAGGGRGGGKQMNGNSAGNSLSQIVGGGRQEVRNVLTTALEQLASASSPNGREDIPRVAHAKLLNWRTSQVEAPLLQSEGDSMMLSAENGRIILTGDWVKESSLEGCYQAGAAAAKAVVQHLEGKMNRK